jgi:RHS repeat-associated protein
LLLPKVPYDGAGTRVVKTASGGNYTVYLFSGSRDIAEYDVAYGQQPNASAPSREFIYAGVLPGSGLVASVLPGTPPTITYFHSDHLSVRLETDGTSGSPTYGQMIGQQGHYPFGEVWYTQNASNGEWVFTNYQRDGESGFDYAMARYYDSLSARFCSVDPVGGQPADPQSWNRYVYVRNDPINLTDPAGLSWLTWLFRGLGAIFAVLSIFNFGFGPLAKLFLGLGGVFFNGLALNLPSGPYPGSTPSTFPGNQPYQISGIERMYAVTPPFVDPGATIGGFGSGGEAVTPSPVSWQPLGDCVFSLYGVTLAGLTPSAPGVNGQFTGFGPDLNDNGGMGYGEIIVTNDVQTYDLARMNREHPAVIDPTNRSTIGFTDPLNPYMTYTTSGVGPYFTQLSQTVELGNSLSLITGAATAEQAHAQDLVGKPPGLALWNCLKSGGPFH